MRTFKRVLSFLLVVAMLASMAIVVSAEETAIIEAEVQNSITIAEDARDDSGKGLAFRIQMNIQGAQKDAYNQFVNTNATATVDGVEYKVVKMGAVMANQAADIANMDNLTLADVTGHYVLDIQAKYLCAEPTADSCEFAVRITNLPEQALGRAIGCRPYIVLEKGGVQSTIYGDGDIATFNSTYYVNAPEETPVLDVSSLKTVITKDRLSVTAASAEYVAYETTTYVEAFKVSLTLSNFSANAKTSVGDAIACAFKDAEGTVLGTTTVAIDELTVGNTKDVEFYVPVGTATIEPTDINLNYVPDIIMPAIGSDIDVTKKKNRIRVSAAEASFNEDGTIHVKWTFKNYTSNWITEETDYIKYGYYKDGTRKGLATLYIGVIDTKKNPVKTFEFDVPAYTTEVRITSSKIVYWTEWA
ncbi:MAG: hypothetical protein IKA50_05015 [Clostridia bacterium]|nr:hypothetical protein [Clostridia bacterium]